MTNHNITPFDSNPNHRDSQSSDEQPSSIDKFLMEDSHAQDLSQHSTPTGNQFAHKVAVALGGLALAAGVLYWSMQPDRRVCQAGLCAAEYNTPWRGVSKIEVTPTAAPYRPVTSCEINVYTNEFRQTTKGEKDRISTATPRINSAQFGADTVLCRTGQRLLDRKAYQNTR